MGRLTAFNMVRAIKQLPRDRAYDYIAPITRTKVAIEHVEEPGGPIVIRRWNPSKGQGRSDASRQSISSEMIWRYANAFTEDAQ